MPLTLLPASPLRIQKATVQTVNDVLSRSTPFDQKGVDRLD